MRYLINIFIFLVFSQLLFAQKYKQIDVSQRKFYYEYTFFEEHGNPNSVKSHQMVLEVGSQCSKFYSTSAMYADSLFMLYANEPSDVAFSKLLPQVSGSPVPAYCNYYVYKNYPEKGTTLFTGTDMSIEGNFLVNEKIKFNWEIDNNSDTLISGLSCIKAKTQFAGRKYIAWFTLAIPINDGPYKFYGLPGLIVFLHDSKNEHVFKLVSIKNVKKPIYFVDKDFISTDAKGFVKALEASKAELIRMLDNVTFSDDAMKYKAVMRIQRRNNFIELY